MIDIKKLIITSLALFGFVAIFAIVRAYAPLWLYVSLYIIILIAVLISISYKPKPKLRHWLISLEYENKDKRICRKITLLKGIDKPFFTKEDVDGIFNWIRFNCIEITESTAGLISKKIEEQDQLNNKDNEPE